MLIGCIADDFTGAGDIANTLSRAGMRTRLFFSPLRSGGASNPDSFDAAVVALKSRSAPPALAVEQSIEALHWLQASNARQIIFKICSTFDSTPKGNIGPVAEALADALGVCGVMVCPAFPENGRTVYQGHLFVGDRLLNECGMQDHPINPMTDPDIRRWLQLQCSYPVGHVPLEVVTSGSKAVAEALNREAEGGRKLVIADAITDDDISTIGKALKGVPLLAGGSAIAMGLPINFEGTEACGDYSPYVGPRGGPGVVLSGSCSQMTLRQVESYARSHPSYAVAIPELVEGSRAEDEALRFVRDNLGDGPIVYSTGSGDQVREVHERYGRERVSERTEAFFGNLARKVLDLGLERIVVAGGETSGAVIQALELSSLDIGPEIAAGVPSLYAENGKAFALKSGNFGDVDFFETALHRLGAGHVAP